jgi:oxygenase
MPTPDAHTQTVVVGAGPVGLLLAGELRLGGAGVVVLEERDAPTTESRASTLHARTMESFDSRGLLEKLGSPPNERRGHFGGIPLDLTLPSPYPGQWKVPQTRTEQILQEWALSLGADIRRGYAVREVSVEEDHVDVIAAGSGRPLRVRGRYLVGCDGEESTVRRLVAADFPGVDAEREMLRADVAGIEIADRRFHRLERGLAIAARRGDGVTRVMVHEFGSPPRPNGDEPGYDTVADTWKRVTGEDITGGVPLWVNSFGDASRQLSRYRHGRVLFAGDAAHRQLPVGGQALNLGLQDAFNLGWKLAGRLRGEVAWELLDTYHAERHAVGKQVLSNIAAQAMLLLGGPEVEAVRTVFGELIGIEAARRRLAGMISGLDIRYDVGPGDHPLVGARLPHAALKTAKGRATTTTALLRAGRGVLLDLTGDVRRRARLREVASGWARRVDVLAAEPGAGNGLPDNGALLVRPDGYVAWAGAAERDLAGTSGLAGALLPWFGRPTLG